MKTKQKKEAIKLRKNGFSITKIAKNLDVSKGSVSVWVKDVLLTEEQKNILKENSRSNNKNLQIYSQERKTKHEKIRKGYRQEGFERAKDDDVFRVICGIYWGDGRKSKNTFSVTNCDSKMINLVGCWLCKEGFREKITFVIQCADKTTKSNEELKKWWKENLNFLDDSMFRKFTRYKINRASQWKRKDKQPNGTAKVSVYNTRLVQMIFGGIEYISQIGG